jgi:hypothetical protein
MNPHSGYRMCSNDEIKHALVTALARRSVEVCEQCGALGA